MPFEFGDVVLVPFPFVISSRAYNDAKPNIVVMAVTSQLRATTAFGEIWVEGWKAAGLLKPSAIKPVFATLEKTLVIRRLGTLASADKAILQTTIGELFK
jgi:mRNA interferase MazF